MCVCALVMIYFVCVFNICNFASMLTCFACVRVFCCYILNYVIVIFILVLYNVYAYCLRVVLLYFRKYFLRKRSTAGNVKCFIELNSQITPMPLSFVLRPPFAEPDMLCLESQISLKSQKTGWRTEDSRIRLENGRKCACVILHAL